MQIFGENVRKVRLDRKISLQDLSSLCGVSPSMLSNIERGEKTPSLRVAMMISEALGIRFSDLAEPAKETVSLIRKSERIRLFTDSGQFQQRLSPLLSSEGVDVAFCVLPPLGSTGSMSAHSLGSTEFIIVLLGRLESTLNGQTYVLDEGDTLSYKVDVVHSFANPLDSECEYIKILRI